MSARCTGGRVIYADWLPGLGLLTIIDHGEGYLSLYGHNDRLYKAAGDTVAAGDVIAASGDSGGSSRPQLYFEIRKGSRPVDPGPWFRHSARLPPGNAAGQHGPDEIRQRRALRWGVGRHKNY